MLQPELSGLATRASNLLKNKGFAATYILPPHDVTEDGDVESNPGPTYILPPRDLTMDGDVEANPGPNWTCLFRLRCCAGAASSTLDRPVTR